jgi:hypothetical protein
VQILGGHPKGTTIAAAQNYAMHLKLAKEEAARRLQQQQQQQKLADKNEKRRKANPQSKLKQ